MGECQVKSILSRGRFTLTSHTDFAIVRPMTDHLETELKFYLSGFETLRNRLPELGADRTDPNTLEYNVRYETADERLRKTKCLLRLRKARRTTLTFKSPPPTADSRFKTHRELEVKVDDFDALDAILQALGFHRRQVYEKWRETWQLDAATICLDTMPYGHFLEIEGQPDAIIAAVGKLGLSWHRRIIDTYLGMFEQMQKDEKLGFNDLTFANFQHVTIDFDRYRPMFEAAGKPSR